MKMPDSNDEAARKLWRERKRSTRAHEHGGTEALEKLLFSPEGANDEVIAWLLANDSALLDAVIAAHRQADSPPITAPADALARAKALVRAPERPTVSVFRAWREWLVGRFTLPAAARGLALAASLALVCAVGFVAGQRNHPADLDDLAIVPVELLGGGGYAFDMGALFSMGGGQ
jgi:hypothetical protein